MLWSKKKINVSFFRPLKRFPAPVQVTSSGLIHCRCVSPKTGSKFWAVQFLTCDPGRSVRPLTSFIQAFSVKETGRMPSFRGKRGNSNDQAKSKKSGHLWWLRARLQSHNHRCVSYHAIWDGDISDEGHLRFCCLTTVTPDIHDRPVRGPESLQSKIIKHKKYWKSFFSF